MSAKPENSHSASGDRGVFGNLPSARPGVRSPRRKDEKGRSPRPASERKPSAASRPKRRPPAPPAPSRSSRADEPGRERVEAEPSRRTPGSPPASQPADRKGIEDVAWAGVTVAAEAATLGVRLFSRALEAVRERR